MSSWKHYPWISAPKRIFKDGIWYYDWVSVSIVIDWKDNTMVAVEICLVKDIYRMANYVSILIKSSVYILKILSHISVLSQRKISHAYNLLISWLLICNYLLTLYLGRVRVLRARPLVR